jgi:hypothetical protein
MVNVMEVVAEHARIQVFKIVLRPSLHPVLHGVCPGPPFRT